MMKSRVASRAMVAAAMLSGLFGSAWNAVTSSDYSVTPKRQRGTPRLSKTTHGIRRSGATTAQAKRAAIKRTNRARNRAAHR